MMRLGTSGGPLLLLFIHGILLLSVAEAGQVNVKGHLGGSVTLRCLYPGSESPDSIIWFKSEYADRVQIAYRNRRGLNSTDFHGSYSRRLEFTNMDPELKDASIAIKNLELQDDGDFFCFISALDAREISFTLELYISPKATLEMSSTDLVDGGAAEMAVATCVAWSGKPAGLVTWSEHPNVGRVSQLFEVNPNNTETLKSEYWMVPTYENHGRNLTCRVRHPAMTANVEMTITLNIHYQPKVTITGYQDDWFVGKEGTLTCAADANPAVTEYAWSKNDAMLDAQKGQVLHVGPPLTAADSGRFSCRAGNSVGFGTATITVTVHPDTNRSPALFRAFNVFIATAVTLLLQHMMEP